MLVTMDQVLKVFRAQQHADTAVEIDDSYPPNPTHPPPVTTHDGLIPPSPVIKEETTTATASTSTKQSAKPSATSRNYTWSRKPTSRLNTPITDAPFLTTVTTQYPAATPNILLTCAYDDNPRKTITAALNILGIAIPMEAFQTMFKNDHTISGSTLTAILKENDTSSREQKPHFRPQCTFLGHSGPNFGQNDTNTEMFKGSHNILCQIDCEAHKAANHRRTSHLALFSPHMNTVMTCHNTSDKGKIKHAWVLGTELI
jgi:hypothetical protein